MTSLTTSASIAALTALSIAASSAPAVAAPYAPARWSGAWTTSMTRPVSAPWFTTWAETGFDHQTVRQTVRLSTSGSQLRIRLSNAYGTTPLRLTGASVGRTDGSAAVVPGTIRPVRFGHAESVIVPAHGRAVSDPVHLPVTPREQLAVTLYFDAPTGPATFHQVSTGTVHRAFGDHREDTAPDAFTATEPGKGSWYYLEGVEVAGGRPADKAVIAFGESTTDGFGATPGEDNRYPDHLAERLIATGRKQPVLNAGISSNKMLADSACAGDSALSRFQRDVLDQPQVGTVIISHGMNDIIRAGDHMCGSTHADPPVTLERLVDAHRTLIRAAHARGIKAIGATLMPFHDHPLWTPEADKLRQALNTWIRTSGEYDGVADFEKAIDPNRTGAIPAGYHMGDGLHPSPLGYRTIADSVDLDALR